MSTSAALSRAVGILRTTFPSAGSLWRQPADYVITPRLRCWRNLGVCGPVHSSGDSQPPKSPSSSPSSSSSSSSSSSTSSSSDEEDGVAEKKPSPPPSRKEAVSKLHDLLQRVKNDDTKQMSSASEEKDTGIELPKPKVKTRQDLKTISIKGVEPELVAATHNVARLVRNGDPDISRKVESDLLRQLRLASKDSAAVKKEGETAGMADMKSLLGDMKVESTPAKKPLKSLTEEQRQFLELRKSRRREARGLGGQSRQRDAQLPLDIFGAKPLGIFTPDDIATKSDSSKAVKLETWDKCQARHLRILGMIPPRNFLEDMIHMTEKGILWHFPINNEQGMDEEKMEPFHHHVFLERHLEPWCPPRGPIRHFMELVCVGLQKNPYMTVEKKLGHINWFKDYFSQQEKQEILKLGGALEMDEEERVN